jgi:hypothetical protein
MNITKLLSVVGADIETASIAEVREAAKIIDFSDTMNKASISVIFDTYTIGPMPITSLPNHKSVDDLIKDGYIVLIATTGKLVNYACTARGEKLFRVLQEITIPTLTE